MATLLQIVQDACVIAGLDKPTSVVSSPSASAVKALAHLHVEGLTLRRKFLWPQLTRQHTITIVANQKTYPLPVDFDRHVLNTSWDRSQGLPVTGPLSSLEWQYIENANVGINTVSQGVRFWTWLDNQIHLSETPTSAEAGSIISFEYQSLTWIRHKKWEPSVLVETSARRWHNGNRYINKNLGGVTTGTTPPTHTTGTISDGGVTWAFVDVPQERFASDQDEPLLDSLVLQLMLQGALCEDKNAFEQSALYRKQAQDLATQACNSLKGEGSFNLLDSNNRSGAFLSNNTLRII